MIEQIIGVLWGPLGGILAGFGAVIAALVMGRSQRKAGAAEQRAKDATDTSKRVEAGRQAVQSGRNSGSDADQRLRDNDGRW
jgi:hypothetical protein